MSGKPTKGIWNIAVFMENLLSHGLRYTWIMQDHLKESIGGEYCKRLEIKAHQSITTYTTIKSHMEMFSRFGVPKIIFFQITEHNLHLMNLRTSVNQTTSDMQSQRLCIQSKDQLFCRKSKESIQRVFSRLGTETTEVSYGIEKCTPEINRMIDSWIAHWIRIQLDLLKPDVSKNIDKALIEQKLHYDKHAKPKIFTTCQQVWV